MATTTTNYSFDVPTSSDLVKNGATAIAELGQDIDTFLFRPFTRNAVINGGMDIWQRGTSIAQTAAIMYGADRWCSNRGGLDTGSTISRQVTGDTTNLPFIQYCARVQRNSGNASTNIIYFSQSIESTNAIPLVGRTVTFSFYARAGANYSSASNALSVTVATGTGTDQNILSTWTGSSSAIGGTQTATLTTTWQRFTYTGTAAATGTELGIYFNYTPVGTASTNDYFEVTGVQLEVGNKATPFIRAGGTIQGELAACQRYYQTSGTSIYSANVTSGSTYATNYFLPVQMRTSPTVTPAIVANSGFPATNPAVGSVSAAGGYVTAVSNGTTTAGYYSFTFTASAEL
jgi:hypothetical protein